MNSKELSLICSAILTKSKYFMDKKEMVKYMFELAELIEINLR